MRGRQWLDKLKGKELMIFSLFTILLLFTVSFIMDTPANIWEGEKLIVISRDALITDYFELAGYGAAFFNAGLVLSIAFALVAVLKVPFIGMTMAVFFINVGYALWGKNPINIMPIIFGVILYAVRHKATIKRYIYTALFGTCLAPLITELAYVFPFSNEINIILAVVLGILVGFLLPPLSMHTASMHMGYNLFNVGFSGGIVAFVMVCILDSFGIESNAVFIWKAGMHPGITIGMFVYFIITFIYGFFISGGKLAGLKRIMLHPGRAVADFVQLHGAGATLMNMSLVGIVSVIYILLIGGDFSGPVIGAIMTAFGFAAFGAHLKNYLPVMLGVYLYTFIGRYQPTTPGIQLAAIFAVGLAPIAGQFGIIAGIIAGMLHSTIVMCTSDLYGGLNLYNNGFSAGWVAIVMVPALEGFMRNYVIRRKRL